MADYGVEAMLWHWHHASDVRQRFNLHNGQMRTRESFGHNAIWYLNNLRVGDGDLDVNDVISIALDLDNTELFFTVPEAAEWGLSFYDEPYNPADSAQFVIMEGEVRVVTRDGSGLVIDGLPVDGITPQWAKFSIRAFCL